MKMTKTVLVLCAALVASALSAPVWAKGSDLPKISGPITGGEHGAPFSAPALDLDAYGYIAEEFFLDGAAAGYRLAKGSEQGQDGKWSTKRESETAPYRTRILVVRPASHSDFNGTVVVHWQNVTAGYELGTVTDGEYLRGYAWVGVSAQKIGVHGFPGPEAAGLEQWDPERYGSLNHPGDAYSYDIFTQAGRAIGPDRPKSPVDPMGGLQVERLVAAGASQSASRLRTYINGVHAIEKVFDGYIPYIDFASTIPFAADQSGERRRGQRRPTRVREDLDVPVFVVNSETETEAYLPARQPETDKFRFWEVAGTSHVSVAREAAANAEGLDSPNWLSYTPAYNAAVRHMHVWLTKGTPPPIMPTIETVTGDNDRQTVKRDSLGNALGGVRLPGLVVPSAQHSGRGKQVSGGSRFGFLYGRAVDFEAEELAKLYPDRSSFLARYDKALEEAVGSGVVLKEEAAAMRDVAEGWAKKSFPSS